MSHSTVASLFSVTVVCSLSLYFSVTLIFKCLQISQWIYAVALLCLFIYSVLANSEQPNNNNNNNGQ